LRDFDAAMSDSALPRSAKIMGRQVAWQLAVIVQRIARSLPKGAAWIRSLDGSWIEAADRPAGVRLLLPRILDWGLQHRSDAAPPPLPGLYRQLVRLHARRMGGQRRCVVAPRGRLKFNLDAHLRATGLDVAGLRLTQDGFGEYFRLVRNLWRRAPEIGIAPLGANDEPVRAWVTSFAAIANRFRDPLLQAAWEIYARYFRAHLPALGAILRETPRLMDALNASLAVCYEGNSWLACAMLDAARSAGKQAVVVNHNSHSRTGTGIADAVLGFLLEQRTANPAVTASAHWSPDWKGWGASGARVRHLAYRYSYPPIRLSGDRFRILHAGNYQNWSDFIPWVAETSHEYVAGLAALASAMRSLPDAELVIRVRSKAEVNPQVVKSMVELPSNVSVCGTDAGFLGELAQSDLLVSYFSTTVAQALQMGKPVLLWGSTQRFCQFLPSWNPPTHEARYPVYAVRDAQALPAMLRAIGERHRGRPLSPEEVEQYRNRPQDPLLAELPARLLAS
jgi:hypothetical protein